MVLSTLNFAAWEAKHGPSLETTLPFSPPAAETPNTNAFFERPGVSESMDRRQGTLLESKPISKPGDFSASKTASNDNHNPGIIDYRFRFSACKGAPSDGRTYGERHRTGNEQADPWAGTAITGQTFSRNHGMMDSPYGRDDGDGRRNDAVGWDNGNQQDAAVVAENGIAPEKGMTNQKQREGYKKRARQAALAGTEGTKGRTHFRAGCKRTLGWNMACCLHEVVHAPAD